MQKVTFNNAGLQLLLLQLYALSDVALQNEVTLLEADFKQWLLDRFNFSPSQLADLDEVDSLFMDQACTQCAYFIGNRLPISLSQSNNNLVAKEKEDRGKLYRSEQKVSNSFNLSLGNSQTESLSFSMEYFSPINS